MTPQDDYISIAKFARIEGVSLATVYKQVNKMVDNQLLTILQENMDVLKGELKARNKQLKEEGFE